MWHVMSSQLRLTTDDMNTIMHCCDSVSEVWMCSATTEDVHRQCVWCAVNSRTTTKSLISVTTYDYQSSFYLLHVLPLSNSLCMCVCLSVCLLTCCLSVCVSTDPAVCVCLSVCLLTCCVCLSVCLLTCRVCLSVCLLTLLCVSVCLCVYWPCCVCLSVCLSADMLCVSVCLCVCWHVVCLSVCLLTLLYVSVCLCVCWPCCVCLCPAGSRSGSPSSRTQPAVVPAASSRLHSRVPHTANRQTSPTRLYGISHQQLSNL